MLTSRYLEEKISKKFSDQIHILQSSNQKVVAPKGIATIDDSVFTHLKDLDIVQAAASILCSEIMTVNKSKLPDSLNSKRLIEGDCSVPPTVCNFIASVIGDYCRQC